MVSILSLWLPILLSAVAVFIASSIIHMVLGYHASDFQKVPDEEAARAAFKALSIPPGDYVVPRAGSSAEMKDPVFVEKMKTGPNVVMTVLPPWSGSMSAQLGQWFLFAVIVAVFTAYVVGRVFGAGAPYLSVFRIAGTVTFVAYALGAWPASIWYGKSTNATVKGTFDAFIFALLTGGIFGWLWPN
jgi:hypothetical protein